MKRIIVLAVAACLILGAALNASATEFKASGSLWVGYDYLNIDNDSSHDSNKFTQRFRTQIEMITSENLSGVVFFEIDQDWGRTNEENAGPSTGGALAADGVNIETKRAYLDFKIPSTAVQVRAGIQGVALPSTVAGNPVLDEDVAAIVASTSYNGINFTGFFARPYDSERSETTVDVFGAIASTKFDAATISPYIAFANTGDKATAGDVEFNHEAQWYGMAVELAPISNFVISFDGVYGKEADRDAGFLVAGKVAYVAQYATPSLMAWYASGNDDDGEGIMPSINSDCMVATPLVGGGAQGPMSDTLFGTALGKWGVALQAKDLTFIEKIDHTLQVTYIQGTNEHSADIENWGDDDRAVELDAITVYSMYDNLDFILDLAYVFTDFDSGMAKDTDNVFKAAVLAQYNF